MRLVGTTLMIVGALGMILGAMLLFGMGVRANGVEMLPAVSVPGALVGGAVLIVGGAWLRRHAKRHSAPAPVDVA